MAKIMFTTFSHRLLLGIPFLLFLLSCNQPTSGQVETKYGSVAKSVASMMESEHYQRLPMDDAMSGKVLEAYLEMLDPRHIYFTQKDVDEFNRKYRTKIDDGLQTEAIPAASDIYGVLVERVRSYMEFGEKTLTTDFTFDSDRTVEITRRNAPWPKDEAEQQKIWGNLIEESLLRDMLTTEAEAREASKNGKDAHSQKSESSSRTPQEKILKRQREFYKGLVNNNTEDVATLFIKAITRAYDPHSEFYSAKGFEDFKIGMNKSLKGIGAMLSLDDDDIPEVKQLVIGGPAAKQGELKEKDRIIGVGQGDAELVDVTDKKLSDTVDLIRGEVGSVVTLKVRRPTVGGIFDTLTIRIVRDEVDLKDQLATADLISTKDPAGNPQKIGWIRLPSFYSDMDGGETSTTKDVQRLLTRLTRFERIDGLVIDLRDDGGGSLEEAINMTGLFIPRGPVVQSRDWRGNRDQKISRNANPQYRGPLVVLTNKASASASEIFAAALQDYNRAIIIGDTSTFGKGTVQQVRNVYSGGHNRFRRETSGAVKLTIQTFFRINGESTQLKGVIPDLQLPSIYEIEDFGEASLTNPLIVEPIEPADYRLFSDKPLPIEALRSAVEERLANNQDFKYIIEDVAREKNRLKENQISLNKQTRQLEVAKEENEAEARKQERIARFARMRDEEKDLFKVYTLTQDNYADEGLKLKSEISSEELTGMSRASEEEKKEEEKLLEYPHLLDPYERETIRILQDFIAIEQTGKPVHMSSIAER